MNDFLRKIAMSEPLFDDWDDFMDAVDKLEDKDIVERFTNEDGEISLRLTESGKQMAEMLDIKELAKEDMGVEKYRKFDNNRKPSWG
jgi:DNA-binding MarR family transcriptional regulator